MTDDTASSTRGSESGPRNGRGGGRAAQVVMERLRKRLPPTWTQLRAFGKSKLLQSSYLWLIGVPIAARLLAQLENPLELTIFGQTHNVHLGLPFSWYSFYFAAVAFSVASLLYSVFCPKIIKEFPTFSDYLQSGGARPLGEWLADAPGTQTQETGETIEYELRAALRRSDGDPPTKHMEESMKVSPTHNLSRWFTLIRREELGDLFYVCTKLYEQAKTVPRVLALAFYFLGFVLTFVVVVQGFPSVVRSFCGEPCEGLTLGGWLWRVRG